MFQQRKLPVAAAAFAALLAAALPALAQHEPQRGGTLQPDTVEPPATEARTTFFERGFLQDAESSGLVQIGAGNAAVQDAVAPNVRNFAQMMVADHTNINDELQRLALKKGVTLPPATDAGRQQALDRLRQNRAGGFDEAYLQLAAHESQQALSLYQRAAESSDGEVRGLARRTLPAIQHHLQLAQALSVNRNAPLLPPSPD
jgi:putative membrane protein